MADKDKSKKYSCETIDDLIHRLQALKAERGNLPVRVRLPGMNRKPTVCGIRYEASKDRDGIVSSESIDIVPKFDVMGAANKLAGTNSLICEMANIKTLFVTYAKYMMSIKALLDDFSKRGVKGMYNGRIMEVVPPIKSDFTRLYDIAKEIRDTMKLLADFNENMKKVINEPILESDYAATFAHHIDMSMTDSEFAKLITKGVGDKTSVQRLAVYQDVLRKINDEIANRRRRIQALEKRIKADEGSNEAMNARILKDKSASIVVTLMKRRDYIVTRYTALKDSILKNISSMDEDIEQMMEEHADFQAPVDPKKKKRRVHA